MRKVHLKHKILWTINTQTNGQPCFHKVIHNDSQEKVVVKTVKNCVDCVEDQIGIWLRFLMKGKTGEPGKTRHRTRTTLVGGKHSRQCPTFSL